ncbi:MAG: ATP-grasp domain-containing protein [Pyrinomonadaceae bacterium]|nr:ATP-grasp domain-containing protein [Pyrinomonadaceae bacterium]
MKIYISGLYSGTNPQPGVGIARSLRTAFPGAKLIGVEYSNRCSGIHWKDFDDIWLQRPWEEINLTTHAEEIRKVLDSGALWISSIDLEIMWFARVFPDGHPNLLTPAAAALEQIAKPAISAHEGLPVKIPTFVTTEISDWDLHAFCRQHDWKVWLKGPYYEAVRAGNWMEFEERRRILSKAWATEKLFLQTHVSGYEESIALSAYRGKLLDCVRMRKRDLTELSKTWAGDISEVEEDFLRPLREIIRKLDWTGGAELEMVRDADNQLWLLEINPRFPAWIHGSTITGRNMPAILVEGATGVRQQISPVLAEEFTRVVMEIPVRSEYPLSPLPEPLGGEIGHSLKHPSGLIQFASRLHKTDIFNEEITEENGKTFFNAPKVPASFIDDLDSFDLHEMQTPASLFLENTASGNFRSASELVKELSSDELNVTNAYSIKTNPDERLIKLALDSGFLAETISILEVKKAIQIGFKPEQLILNGPGKWWRQEILPEGKFYSIFCDSIEELEQVLEKLENGKTRTNFLGVRLRTPNVRSRFGIPIDTPEVFEKLIEAVRRIPKKYKFAVHFHMASSNVGVGHWWHLFESMLRWCNSIEALTGRLIEILDIGGGWFPEDLQKDSAENFKKAIALIPEFLPNVRRIISEPGKALAQPTMAVAMQILELRNSAETVTEAVVDGSIAELPMYFFFPHRILYQNAENGSWKSLSRGKTRLLGRLCMEHDIVASNVELPENAQVGDILVFCDAGAYDRSMSYVFGRG